MDSWLMWRLHSSDRETRNAAAEKLAERKCIRAVPGIVRAIAQDPSEDIRVMEVPHGREGSAMRYKASPVARALRGIGEPAWPALKRFLADERLDARTRRILKRIVPASLHPRVADQ